MDEKKKQQTKLETIKAPTKEDQKQVDSEKKEELIREYYESESWQFSACGD